LILLVKAPRGGKFFRNGRLDGVNRDSGEAHPDAPQDASVALELHARTSIHQNGPEQVQSQIRIGNMPPIRWSSGQGHGW
jgi:hypothetical protein